MRWVGLGSAVGVASALVVTGARADVSDSIALSWEAPAGCPSREEVLAQVQKLTGPLAPDATLRADVVISAAPDNGFHASIRTEAAGTNGSRTLDGASCAALTEAIVVMLALAADPYKLNQPAVATTVAPKKPRPAVVPERAPHPAGSPPAALEAVPALHLHAAVVAAGDLGTLDGAAPGAGLALALSRGGLRLEVQGTAWSDRFIASSKSPGSGGLLGFLSAASRLCLEARGSIVSVGGCAGVDLVYVHGRGIGIAHSKSDGTTWAAPEIGLWVRQVTSGRLNPYAGLAATFPLQRPEADVTGLGAVYRPWAVTGLATIGLDVRIF